MDAGGGLVTGEWVVYKHGTWGQFAILGEALPVAETDEFRTSDFATYSRVTPEETLDGGVPEVFTFRTDWFSGTETR